MTGTRGWAGALTAGILCVAGARDPFWPIGYTGSAPTPAPAPPRADAAPTAEPAEVRTLTDEELRDLARQESARIKEILDRKATAVFNNQVHALVNGRWVKQGDSLRVEVLGNLYRLEILKLTTDNIELEAHRTRGASGDTTQE